MNHGKPRRQREILRLVGSGAVRTQKELSAALAASGIAASQGTLSRDLRELGVAKTAAGYAAPASTGVMPQARLDLGRVVAEFLQEARTAQNLVVLKTPPGGAAPLARGLDAAAWPEIVGTVAGDDTIFIATADRRAAARVRERIEAL